MLALNFENEAVAKFDSIKTFGALKVYATAAKTVQVSTVKATCDGKSFTKCLSLGGGGKVGEYRCIEFSTTSSCTLDVYAKGASGRMLALKNEEDTLISSFETSSDFVKYTFRTPSAGKYFLLSLSSGISICEVDLMSGAVTNQPVEEVEEVKTEEPKKDVIEELSEIVTSFDPAERPIGFASINAANNFGGFGGQSVVVKTRDDFWKYATKGGYVIYVDGMIDLSDGRTPDTCLGRTDAIDAWVKEKSEGRYSTYQSFMNAYIAQCTVSTNDTKESTSGKSGMYDIFWRLHEAYQDEIIRPVIASNTTIIGLTGSGFKKGGFRIQNGTNIAIRNIIFENAVDPFPYHEANDGYNAKTDCIQMIEDSSNVWIDHCTFRDTIPLISVKTGGSTSEKFQIYDGAVDANYNSTNITVSNCLFNGHDKTCLYGSSDSEVVTRLRTITHCNNFYKNCGQRLPMVRNFNCHSFNNYFDVDTSSPYSSQCAIQPRYKAKLLIENNYFGSGIKYAYKGDSKTQTAGVVNETLLYEKGCVYLGAKEKNTYYTKVNDKPFEVPYSYTLKTAVEARDACIANAGTTSNKIATTIEGSTSSSSIATSVKKFAKVLMDKTPGYTPVWGSEGFKNRWNYIDGVMLKGFLDLYKVTKDETYKNFIVNYVNYYINSSGVFVRPTGAKGDAITAGSLDSICESQILFDLYNLTKDNRYLNAIEASNSVLQGTAKAKDTVCFNHKNTYPNQVWLDGFEMYVPFYAQYAKMKNLDSTFIEIANQIIWVANNLKDPTTGLYYHGNDVNRTMFWADKETGNSKSFWLRSIGWWTMGMVDSLEYFPEGSAKEMIKKILSETIKAMDNFRTEDNQFFHLVNLGQKSYMVSYSDYLGPLNNPEYSANAYIANYKESSGNAIMAYCYMKAARMGWIDSSYLEKGKKIFEATYENSFNADTCALNNMVIAVGLGPEAKQYRDGTTEYYLAETVGSNDGKGAGPFLMAFSEYLR